MENHQINFQDYCDSHSRQNPKKKIENQRSYLDSEPTFNCKDENNPRQIFSPETEASSTNRHVSIPLAAKTNIRQTKYISLGVKMSDWNKKHDLLLLESVYRYKCDWKKIQTRVKKFSKRTFAISTLKSRYKNVSKKHENSKSGRFSRKEDERICELALEHERDWMKIGKEFVGRTPLSIKNRYYYLKGKELKIKKLDTIETRSKTHHYPSNVKNSINKQSESESILRTHVDKILFSVNPTWLTLINNMILELKQVSQ